ncbi:glycoside hydrolase family 31 protein [Flavobacterium gilvum]|nr:glycoside hydrolase family 31 protein [Flavobacterium gilvum]KFC59597.1 xylosidase [Flavobacterium gilvum]
MKKIVITILFFTFSIPLFSADFERTKLGIKANIQSMDVEVQFYNPHIVRIVKSQEGFVFKKESLSVIKTPQVVNLIVNQQGDIVSLKSEFIQVTLDLKTGKVSFYDLSGKALFTEKDYGTQFTPIKDVDKKTFTVRQAFLLDKDEAIYGLGQQQEGKMNQRGQKLLLRNENTKICIPFIQSTKGYGVFWDNYSPTKFVDNPQEMSLESEVGDGLDYYFLYGKNADGVIAKMRDLTGQSPLLPLWTLGFWQSRERYTSQEEIVGVVEKFRKLGVPLDGIIQDWQYWGGNGNWNSMNFDNPKFSEPQKMIDRIHQLNAHYMISVWASFGRDTKQFSELKEKKSLLNFETYPKEATPYDPYNPEARNLYWEYLSKGLFAKGVDAWWMDSTEPDRTFTRDSDLDVPTHLGTFRSVYNAFPLQTVGGVYDHQRKAASNKRVFILTRSAFAGQQRYGANSWSGDIHGRWDVLRKQIPAGLNFSLCGIPYWNTDIGGFSVDYKGGIKNVAYRELYVRWLQFGTFMPMMRSHGTSTPREIYMFGQKGDWAYDAQEKFINLRYRLLPYNYSTAWDVTNQSGSMMRALVMDFSQDKKVYDINDEYMFGKSLLIAPVTESMYVKNENDKSEEDFSQIKSKQVYLPEGTSWYDFWTGAQFSGGQTISKEVPVDIMPIYVKAGTILPVGPKVQYATEKKWDNLELYVYPGADGEFTLYEDENDNYNYEKGAFSTIKINWNDKEQTLTIENRKGSFPGMLKTRNFNISLITKGKSTADFSAKTDKAVTYKGKEIVIKLK